jgi:hypothetical protein
MIVLELGEAARNVLKGFNVNGGQSLVAEELPGRPR